MREQGRAAQTRWTQRRGAGERDRPLCTAQQSETRDWRACSSAASSLPIRGPQQPAKPITRSHPRARRARDNCSPASEGLRDIITAASLSPARGRVGPPSPHRALKHAHRAAIGSRRPGARASTGSVAKRYCTGVRLAPQRLLQRARRAAPQRRRCPCARSRGTWRAATRCACCAAAHASAALRCRCARGRNAAADAQLLRLGRHLAQVGVAHIAPLHGVLHRRPYSGAHELQQKRHRGRGQPRDHAVGRRREFYCSKNKV